MKTILTIKNSFLILSSENKDLTEGISNVLTFNDMSKAYQYGVFNKERIKKIKFAKPIELEIPSIKIPIGFLDFIESVLADYEHSKIDTRKDINTIKHLDTKLRLRDIDLYDHQERALISALKKSRGIIVSPTGSGKSEIFLSMINMFKQPTLVLFNRTQLAHQTMERAKGRGIEAGIVQGKNVLEKDVTMATVQSVEKLEDIKKYKNLIIDECHNVASATFQEVLKLNHWQRVYGFSATAVNPHKMDLQSATIIASIGPVICEIKSKELMEKEVIAKPTIYMVNITQPDDIEDFSYREAEQSGIIYNKSRNEHIKKIVDSHPGEQVLILTKYVKQGEEINKLIPEAPFIWNEVKMKDRRKAVEEFDCGKFPVLIASRILDEGIDIKNFTVLIIASAGSAFRKTIQRLGRGLRITETKKSVSVYDFIDNTQINLYKHSMKRMKDYKTFGYDNIIKLEEI